LILFYLINYYEPRNLMNSNYFFRYLILIYLFLYVQNEAISRHYQNINGSLFMTLFSLEAAHSPVEQLK